MAKNFRHEGETLILTVVDNTDAVDIASGEGYLAGSIFGVAIKDVPVGEDGPFKVTGVWELPKTTGQAWAQGDRVYWDNSTKKVTTTAGANKLIGVSEAAYLSGDTVGNVRLSAAFTI